MQSIILGTGKIFYGLGSALSTGDNNTLAYTRDNIEETESTTIIVKDKDGEYHEYPALYIADSFDTDKIDTLISPDIKIYVANVKHHKSYLNGKHDLKIISCCKDGLNSTYTSILNDYDCSGTIVAIDNDKSFAYKADKELKNFKVKPAVIDMYCPCDPEYDSERKEIRAYVTRSSIIHFPPGCEDFKVYFPRFLNGSYLISTYAKDDEEFERAVEEKFYLVNLPHFIMGLLAWYYLKYDGSRKWMFSDIPYEKFAEMKKECLKYHETICRSWLTKRMGRWEDLRSIDVEDQLYTYSCIAASRITQLYFSGDTVIRIINPTSGVSMMKLQKHMKVISDALPGDTFLGDIASHLLD